MCVGGGGTRLFFFFNDTATTEIYTLSLHDALPIWSRRAAATSPAASRARSARAPSSNGVQAGEARGWVTRQLCRVASRADRKSTRLNSSHANISYAVFCLKKKKTNTHSSSASAHAP